MVTNVLDFILADVLLQCDKVIEKYKGSDRLKKLIKILSENPINYDFQCGAHGGRCSIRELIGKLKAAVITSPCIDWSRRGKRQKGDGQTIVAHLAALRVLYELEAWIALHECTEDYDGEIIDSVLHLACIL
jgi:hypothetical protein